MKALLKLAKYLVIFLSVCFLLLIASLIPDFVYFMPRAKPPPGMTDWLTFFEWKPEPMGAFRVSTTNGTYYQLLGPAGRWLPSGPAAYSFDAQGNFIVWSADSGDFYSPRVVYVPGAVRERIPVDEVRALLKSNTPAKTNAIVRP